MPDSLDPDDSPGGIWAGSEARCGAQFRRYSWTRPLKVNAIGLLAARRIVLLVIDNLRWPSLPELIVTLLCPLLLAIRPQLLLVQDRMDHTSTRHKSEFQSQKTKCRRSSLAEHSHASLTIQICFVIFCILFCRK